jgi:putative spermidine/putrescine transport system permease protein
LRAADEQEQAPSSAPASGESAVDTSAFSIFQAPSAGGGTNDVDDLPDDPRERLEAIDARWADTAYWAAMKRATWQLTPHYLLRTVDMTMDEDNRIVRLPENQRIFVNLIWRTFVISVVVTMATVALGFPLAVYIASLPPNRAALVMFMVLVPLWTSILVRTTAWLVLLQDQGLLNDTIMFFGLSDERLQLVRNRFGVYIAMIHICLPFMVLPIYSSISSLNKGYLKAAASLGAHPIRVFTKVYVPLVFPGVAAGSMLVFILALGFYITPAIVGGPRDQMVSSFIADAVNRDLNWGLAAALTLVLIAMVILTFMILRRFTPAAATR